MSFTSARAERPLASGATVMHRAASRSAGVEVFAALRGTALIVPDLRGTPDAPRSETFVAAGTTA
jgi:hypothetical protein